MSGAKENNWNFSAEAYEKHDGVLEHAKTIRDKLTSQPWWNDSASVLDFGCGTGLLSRLIAKNNNAAEIQAVDVEERMIEFATRAAERENLQSKFKFRHLKKIDASELGESITSCIYTVTVLGHVRELDLPTVFANLAKAVSPNGRLVVAEFYNINSTHSHAHSHGDGDSHGHGHGHGHSHSHAHSHGHSHGHGDHGHDSHDESKHVSDGGHVHTDLNEEILGKMAEANNMQVEYVEHYTLDMSQVWGKEYNNTKMFFFVAKKSE